MTSMPRWNPEAIADWYERQPWLCGFNYLPRTAINWIELWQAESFDPATIDEELAWAERIGFNTLRTNLHSLVWEADPAGLRDRVDRFLGIAARHDMRTMLCPFDDCGFSGLPSRLGPQGNPMPGVHNSGACASPGRAVVRDRSEWPALERYIRDLVGHFRDDARIVVWDLYNEPGNNWVFVPGRNDGPLDSLLPHSQALVRECFRWAREERPTQPLTAAVWNPAWAAASEELAALSDLVSFHNYLELPPLRAMAEDLRRHGRPLLCTEWLARGLGSLPRTHLPYFAAERIGCWQWGLVNGRTQTHLPWPGLETLAADGTWHHDLLHADGSPYDDAEIACFREALSAPPR
jgi:hypothetical protein